MFNYQIVYFSYQFKNVRVNFLLELLLLAKVRIFPETTKLSLIFSQKKLSIVVKKIFFCNFFIKNPEKFCYFKGIMYFCIQPRFFGTVGFLLAYN